MSKEKSSSHMPLYGVGPIFVIIIAAITAAAFFCRNLKIFEAGKVEGLKIPFIIVGIVLIVLGVILWISGAVLSKLDDNIIKGNLVTTGVYAWVRNPIYSAFLFICTGVIFIIGNLFFLVLPVLYWLFLTILMMKTEEKWLRNEFGEKYDDYCRKVNRCIPWFPM